LRSSILIGCFVIALGALVPRVADATCGEECDTQYSSAIDDCRSQYGDDPADADDLTNCIQEARDDYRSCVDDCASAAISLPHWCSLAVRVSAGRIAAVGASLSSDRRQPRARRTLP
jgi:hypothetical protein